MMGVWYDKTKRGRGAFMNIVTYATPGAFLADNQAYLRDHEVEAQLNLGNAVAHREEPCGPELLFGKVEEQGRAVLLFGYLVPWNLCLDDVAHSDSGVQAARELALWLKAQEIVVPGVNGRQVLCEAFLQVWGSAYELRIAMDAMVLRRLHAPLPKGGALRLAVPEDEEVAAPWIAAFQQEAGHRELPLEMAREKFQKRVEKGTLYLFETRAGTPVFMATVSRFLPHGKCISGVYTEPGSRGQGYCQEAMALLCQRLMGQGDEYVALFVDKTNPVSNRAYQKIGFEIVEDNCDYRLKASSSNPSTPGA